MDTKLIFKILMWLGIGLIAYFFLKLILGLFQGSGTAGGLMNSTTGSAGALPSFSNWFNGVKTPTPASQDNTAALITAGGTAFSSLTNSLANLFKGNNGSGAGGAATLTPADLTPVTIPPTNDSGGYDWSAPSDQYWAWA
jgi:hypothetical protein